jgi:serine O-acetyltransferase
MRVRASFIATFGEPLTARSFVRALLDPGFRATVNLAVQLWCARHGLKAVALWLRLHNVRAYGMDVEVGATVGAGLRIRHPRGIVIHHSARIGTGVAIQQGVTLGVRSIVEGATGGSPVVGDHVSIGAGAALLGDITVGDHAVIGAHAVVLSSVPAGATVVGAPARVVRSVHPQSP